MKYLTYKNKKQKQELFLDGLALSKIADEIATPCYVYSKKNIEENYLEFAQNLSQAKLDFKICYAMKANYNLHILKILASLGSGIDAVSAGEIHRAIKAEIDPKKIVFAGVGKTREEIEFALKNGVEEFSCESEAEMFVLNEVAVRFGKEIKFSLRVNPNVDAKTHDKISTGRKGDKFGVDIDFAEKIYAKAAMLEGLQVYGISTHIGSQITSLAPFEKAFIKIRELCLQLRKNGHNIQSLDFGGGIGVLYKDEKTIAFKDYAEMIAKITKDLNVKITIAPGRAMIANAGLMLSKIIYIKETDYKNFIIIDAAMNDLARPGLYDSYHEILQVEKKYGEKLKCDIVGPICESSDILAKNRELISPQAQDLIVFLTVGAYGSSMSNEYNCRPLIPEILVDDGKFKLIRKRPTYNEMLNLEHKLKFS
ncbi:MAG TPA: diaminopimelate decarboxylase [Rickettsiales bacterium]|nr:diaminopimelate decarboxylase [Rickettsiales bacterium]